MPQTSNRTVSHPDQTDNPHSVTKAQVGLGSVDNTSDADKPVSAATQTALNEKANTSHTHVAADITDFNSATRAQVEAELVAGSNITLTPSGSGASRQITIASTGGGGASFSVGDTIDTAAASAPADGGTWLSHGIGWNDYLRATYSALAARHPYGPACEQLEPTSIPRGGFQCIAKNVGGPWAASTAYAVGDYRRPTANSNPSVTYRCTTAGTSGGSEPTWTTGVGGTIADGGVVWTVENIRYVAITNSSGTGNCIAYSEDHCKTWRSVTAPSANAVSMIAFSGKNFVMTTSGTAFAYYSADGVQWTPVSTPGGARSVSSDGMGKVIVTGGQQSPSRVYYSTDNGVTFPSYVSLTGGTANANYCTCYTDVSGKEFGVISSTGVFHTINSSTWAITAQQTATSMNAISSPGNGRILAFVTSATAAPQYITTADLTATWTACAIAPGTCRAFVYSAAYSRWYGFNNTNASTALYHSTDGSVAWSTLNPATYGIGVHGIDTGDGSFCIAAINTTSGSNASNLQRLATATTFDKVSSIPPNGSTSFGFGEISGKMFACNSGANSIHQMCVNDGTGWRTLQGANANGDFALVDRLFDLGNNVGIGCRGSVNILRTTNANLDNPTWSTVAVYANYLIHDAANTVTIVWDSGSGVRKSTDRMATYGLITNPTSLTDRGFTFRGHGMKFDGFYWFPGNNVNGKAAFAKVAVGSEGDGANWTIEETALDNMQFDFVAENGTIALALSSYLGVVWRRTIGGSWQQVSQHIAPQGSTATPWKDLLWCSGRGRFVMLNTTAPGEGIPALMASADGERWEDVGNNYVAVGRLGYSPTLDQFFFSNFASSNTPIMSELKTFNNATHFRLYQDTGKGISITTYSKAT